MIAVYFNSTPDVDQHPPVARILRYGIFAVSLYAPLIWLACGGAKPQSPDRDVTPEDDARLDFMHWQVRSGGCSPPARSR